MMKLLPYELGKIWKKRSFQALTGVLLAFNLLLLWYLNIPDGWRSPLSAYRAVSADLAGYIMIYDRCGVLKESLFK